jgi:hypothetical protein
MSRARASVEDVERDESTRPPESFTIRRMTCEEFGQEATRRADGWEALLIDLDAAGWNEVAAYREATRVNFPVG